MHPVNARCEAQDLVDGVLHRFKPKLLRKRTTGTELAAEVAKAQMRSARHFFDAKLIKRVTRAMNEHCLAATERIVAVDLANMVSLVWDQERPANM